MALRREGADSEDIQPPWHEHTAGLSSVILTSNENLCTLVMPAKAGIQKKPGFRVTVPRVKHGVPCPE